MKNHLISIYSFSVFKLALSVFLLVIFLAACGEKNEQIEIPTAIIKSETMVSIIVDLHLLDASRNLNLLQPKDTAGAIGNVNMDKYNAAIFKKYGVSRVAFDSSFSFYSSHPTLLNSIYEESLNELSKINAAAQ